MAFELFSQVALREDFPRPQAEMRGCGNGGRASSCSRWGGWLQSGGIRCSGRNDRGVGGGRVSDRVVDE